MKFISPCLTGSCVACLRRCRPPPRIDEENNYELVGDVGRKNGAYILSWSLVPRTLDAT